jgi:peptidoglycan hydrolase CwlO-like protein
LFVIIPFNVPLSGCVRALGVRRQKYVHFMKTRIITIAVAALTVVSVCLAAPTNSSPKSVETPPCTLQEACAELTKTQEQLQQALTRIAELEQQVSSLQQATAKLQQEVKDFGQPRLVPLERK